jgi:hypothetical protein
LGAREWWFGHLLRSSEEAELASALATESPRPIELATLRRGAVRQVSANPLWSRLRPDHIVAAGRNPAGRPSPTRIRRTGELGAVQARAWRDGSLEWTSARVDGWRWPWRQVDEPPQD